MILPARLIIAFIIIMCIVALLCSCVTDKKLQGYAQRYYLLHPNELAHRCAEEYPAKVTPGIVIRKSDTTYLPGVSIPCPEYTDSTGTVKKDSVKCPGIKLIHDTLSVHDTLIDVALVTALKGDTGAIRAAYRAQTEKLNTVIGEKNNAKEQAKNRLYWLIGIGLSVVLYIVMKIKGGII